VGRTASGAAAGTEQVPSRSVMFSSCTSRTSMAGTCSGHPWPPRAQALQGPAAPGPAGGSGEEGGPQEGGGGEQAEYRVEGDAHAGAVGVQAALGAQNVLDVGVPAAHKERKQLPPRLVRLH